MILLLSSFLTLAAELTAVRKDAQTILVKVSNIHIPMEKIQKEIKRSIPIVMHQELIADRTRYESVCELFLDLWEEKFVSKCNGLAKGFKAEKYLLDSLRRSSWEIKAKDVGDKIQYAWKIKLISPRQQQLKNIRKYIAQQRGGDSRGFKGAENYQATISSNPVLLGFMNSEVAKQLKYGFEYQSSGELKVGKIE